MKKKLRLIDMINLIWSTVHDFIYVGIAAGAYWIWKQPVTTRNTYLAVILIVAALVINAIVNYRQHAKLEDRIEKLEAKS